VRRWTGMVQSRAGVPPELAGHFTRLDTSVLPPLWIAARRDRGPSGHCRNCTPIVPQGAQGVTYEQNRNDPGANGA
jgi:hypothetical protein